MEPRRSPHRRRRRRHGWSRRFLRWGTARTAVGLGVPDDGDGDPRSGRASRSGPPRSSAVSGRPQGSVRSNDSFWPGSWSAVCVGSPAIDAERERCARRAAGHGVWSDDEEHVPREAAGAPRRGDRARRTADVGLDSSARLDVPAVGAEDLADERRHLRCEALRRRRRERDVERRVETVPGPWRVPRWRTAGRRRRTSRAGRGRRARRSRPTRPRRPPSARTRHRSPTRA